MPTSTDERRSLADAKAREDGVQHVFVEAGAAQAVERPPGSAQLGGHHLVGETRPERGDGLLNSPLRERHLLALARPGEVAALLQTNPSYIFFAPRAVDPACGPLGAMGRPVTEDVTLAVDPAHLPLGAPVWIGPGVRGVAPGLRIAQDTGSAILGAGRADLFCGTGGAAGARAGALNAPVTLWPLRPTGAA